MNLNDYRMNAYKKSSKSDSTSKKNSANLKSENFQNDFLVDLINEQQKNEKPIKKSTLNSDERFLNAQKKAHEYKSSPELKAATDVLTQGGLIKVSSFDDLKKENVYRRVAKFLILIGVDQAALVLKHLSQEETEKIIPEITSIRTIEPDEALLILEEFNDLIERIKEGGGKETAKVILQKAFGKDKAKDLFDRLKLSKEEKPFSYLSEKSPEKILELLKEETNQARSIVLSYVEPKKAATVINMLSVEDKKEVIIHLAKTKQLLPEVVARIDKVIHEKALKQLDVKTTSIDGKSVLAEILKKMDYKSEQDLIETLSDDDPTLGEDLRTRLFTTEDFLNSDDRYIQKYLRTFTDQEIAYLIGDKNDNFRVKIFSNVSTGRGDLILDEEQNLKPMRKKDCVEITQRFFAHLRKAFEDGDLFVDGRDGEEYI